jgi:RNA polymerase sigma factor (sigma-70 family)
MKVTAVTKFKQGDLYNALKKLGWTQAELAKRSGVSQQTIGHVLNLRNKPSPFNIDRIQKAFAKAGEYLDVLSIWPEDFKGLDKSVTVEQTKEVDLALLGANTLVLHDTMKPNLDDARRLIEKSLAKLTEREANIIRWKHFDGKDLNKIADDGKISRQSISTIYNRALRRLRCSTQEKILREAMDCVV